jgi:cell division septum initiation protein DivIVA
MDIDKALCQLHDEKKRLDAAIAALEAQIAAATGKSRRTRPGRKSMSPQARLEVSQRMARYWAARRAQAQQLTPED